MLKFILLFSLFLVPLYSTEYLDINDQIANRTQQYPTGKYTKLVVFSPMRTGSTLLFNVLRFLFEDIRAINQSTFEKNVPHSKVGKTHAKFPPNKNLFVFIPVRNPIDACYSKWRIQSKNKHNYQVNEIELDSIVRDYIHELKGAELMGTSHYPNAMCLRYEYFVDNFDYLFNVIEKTFSIKIDVRDKNLIKRVLSKENVTANTNKYNSFNNYSQITHFHGEHIDPKTTPPEVEKNLKVRIANKLKSYHHVLVKWGYPGFS